MVSVVELRDYLDFAAQTAYEAGRLTLGYFQTDTLRTEIKPATRRLRLPTSRSMAAKKPSGA